MPQENTANKKITKPRTRCGQVCRTGATSWTWAYSDYVQVWVKWTTWPHLHKPWSSTDLSHIHYSHRSNIQCVPAKTQGWCFKMKQDVCLHRHLKKDGPTFSSVATYCGVGVQVDKESNYILHLYVQYNVEEENLSCVFLSLLSRSSSFYLAKWW